jgi:hypothetical protein
MKAARLTIPILSLAAAAVLSACSAGGPPTAPPSSASVASTSGDVIASPAGSAESGAQSSVPAGVPSGLGALPGLSSTGGASGADALGLLPAKFPLPSGAAGLYGGRGGGATAVVFTVPDASAAIAFYRDALPNAGFPLAADSLGFPLGFTGGGITEGVIGVSGDAVGVSIYGTFTAAGGSSAPGGSSGGGRTITIDQSSTPLTVACENATVNLEGDSDNVTLTGSCHAINVSGDSDHVVAGSASSVDLSGDADEVTVNSGSPAVTKTGLDDLVQGG